MKTMYFLEADSKANAYVIRAAYSHVHRAKDVLAAIEAESAAAEAPPLPSEDAFSVSTPKGREHKKDKHE